MLLGTNSFTLDFTPNGLLITALTILCVTLVALVKARRKS